MNKVSVVILNYNGRAFLEKFLPSVISGTPSEYEIVVADNASTDDSLHLLASSFPTVRVIKNSENGGFSKGYNDALKLVQAEYYILLNSDVEVANGWTNAAITLLDSDRNIGAVQPKILSHQDRSKFDYAGAAGGYIDVLGYPFCRGRIFDEIETDNAQYDDQKEIFWASGACLFIRAELYHSAGGLDEDFFAHMEEIDLCWRIRNMGYKILFEPRSIVYHVGGGTLSRLSPKKTYLNFRNNLFLLIKNHQPKWFLFKLLVRCKLDALAAIKFLASGDFSHFVAVIKAHVSFYGSLAKNLRKRKDVKKLIRSYDTGCIYPRSIVWDYFIKKKRKFSLLHKF